MYFDCMFCFNLRILLVTMTGFSITGAGEDAASFPLF